MGFTLRFTLGTLLVLFCSWSNEAVHLNRLIRQISQNVGNHTSDKLQNIEPETTTQQNILVKGSDQDNRQPKTDSNSEHKIADNNINKLQNSEDSKTTTDEEEKKVREEIGRSIDIKKYTSKEFHSKNNVYKLPLSPDTEKYINPEYDFHHATTHKHSEEFSFYSQLTTPKSSIFDSKFREAVDSVDQKLEHIDESDEFSEESESTENINLEAFIDETNKNDSAANLHYVNYKNIISNNTGNKSSLHKDLVLEAGTNLNFQNFYNHTTFTDENNDANNTNGKAQDKEKKVDISTLSNIIPAKSDLDNAESSTGKSVILTTKKSIVVTKPSSNKNLSHISILSNRIEKETIKAVNPVQTTEENEDQKEIIETVSDVGTSVNISKRPLIFVNMASTQAAVIPDQMENSTKHFQENKLANHSIKLETTADGFKNISTTTVSSIITTIKPATDISDSDEDDSIVSLHTTVLPLSKDTMISPTEFVAELNISTTEAPVTKQIEIETITSILTETSTTPWERVTNQPTLFQPTTLSTIKYENEPTTNSPEAPTIVQAISDEYETITPAPTYQADSTVASNREILKINLVTTTEVATDSAEATNTPVEVTTTLSEITTTSPVVTTTLQEVTTTLQEVTTTSPEITTTSPEITTTSPEITTTSPEITTSSEVIATTTEVLIAPTKINTFPTTTLQSNESDYFVTTESTVRTSKELEIKDNVVTESSFVAISGVQTKKITVEDGGTVISTTPIIDVETSTESVNYGTEDGKIGDYNITDFGIRNETILKPEYKSSGQNEPDAESENATNISIIFSESYEHNNDSDDNSGTVAAITISSIGAVCLILLAGLLIIMRKRQKRFNYGQRCTPVSLDDYSMDNVSVYNSVRRKGMVRSSKRSYGNPAFEDPVCISHPLNFPALGKFANNVEDIKAEFEDIPQITARMNELPEGCDTKNRYANVIPLPETRVFLSLIDGYPNSDYINANYVTGPKNIKGYYIACQAPLQNTVDDFWRMIWEQQSKVILMLTHLFENGVEKCVDYLPPSEVLDCHRLFGDFQVTLKKREVKDKYIISSLQLKNMVSNSWREVTHFWYLGWPEKGVPSEANSLIAFLIEARSYMKCSSLDTKEDTKNNLTNGVAKNEINPVVVHCSPGTGRTGVVIACDIAIREFEQTRLVDVPRIVYKIRRDRATAVQTKEQYAFIYKVINLYATKLTGGILDSF